MSACAYMCVYCSVGVLRRCTAVLLLDHITVTLEAVRTYSA